MPDHIHILIGLRPNKNLADIVKVIKSYSSRLINQKKWTKTKFEWQAGYGAFSYSKSHLKRVINYINTQEKDHMKNSFIDEYKRLLHRFEIQYDDKYIFAQI